MKILIFSDIHGDLGALARHMDTEADYYVAAGDLVNFGRGLERCGEILGRRADRVYVLPGNHETAGQIAGLCRDFGLHDFHEQHAFWGGYHVAGLGYSNPTPFNTPGEYSEGELAQRLEKFSGLKPLILLCHCPPHGTALDQIRPGMHGGSTAVRDFLAREQPEYFFCGHIHEAGGVRTEVGRTQAMNVGKPGWLLEL
ncbi:MAG TPA: metallophosphoesterase [Bryobacteraceae bacterium]|nr:metallophosphoesterase [Bryobacteraceae bacterium]